MEWNRPGAPASDSNGRASVVRTPFIHQLLAHGWDSRVLVVRHLAIDDARARSAITTTVSTWGVSSPIAPPLQQMHPVSSCGSSRSPPHGPVSTPGGVRSTPCVGRVPGSTLVGKGRCLVREDVSKRLCQVRTHTNPGSMEGWKGTLRPIEPERPSDRTRSKPVDGGRTRRRCTQRIACDDQGVPPQALFGSWGIRTPGGGEMRPREAQSASNQHVLLRRSTSKVHSSDAHCPHPRAFTRNPKPHSRWWDERSRARGGQGIVCTWMDPNAGQPNLPSNQAMEEQLMSLLNAEVETLQRGERRD